MNHNNRSENIKYPPSPIKKLIVHFILLIIFFLFFIDTAVRSAQIGDDELALANAAILFVVLSLQLLVSGFMVEKISMIAVVMSILTFDAFEYFVLSNVSLNRFSFPLLTHILLLVNVNIGFVYLAYKKNKGKTARTVTK